jgi:hypothetical protein
MAQTDPIKNSLKLLDEKHAKFAAGVNVAMKDIILA